MAITVNRNPSGWRIIVDGPTYPAPQTFNWTPGANPTIAHNVVAPGSATTFTAFFNTEFQLTIAPSPANGGQ